MPVCWSVSSGGPPGGRGGRARLLLQVGACLGTSTVHATHSDRQWASAVTLFVSLCRDAYYQSGRQQFEFWGPTGLNSGLLLVNLTRLRDKQEVGRAEA